MPLAPGGIARYRDHQIIFLGNDLLRRATFGASFAKPLAPLLISKAFFIADVDVATGPYAHCHHFKIILFNSEGVTKIAFLTKLVHFNNTIKEKSDFFIPMLVVRSRDWCVSTRYWSIFRGKSFIL